MRKLDSSVGDLVELTPPRGTTGKGIVEENAHYLIGATKIAPLRRLSCSAGLPRLCTF